MFWRSLKLIVKINFTYIRGSIIHGSSSSTGNQEPPQYFWIDMHVSRLCGLQGTSSVQVLHSLKKENQYAKQNTFQMVSLNWLQAL